MEENKQISITFKLNSAQRLKLKKWQKIQDQKVAALQQRKYPDYGAIGGAYSYILNPTSIGTALRVSNSITKEEIDLTDYDNW